MEKYQELGLPEYNIPENTGVIQPLEEGIRSGEILFEGDHFLGVCAAPLRPHTYGKHDVLWFISRETGALASNWNNLLRDEALIIQIEKAFSLRQEKDVSLRLYCHDTVRSIRYPLDSSVLLDRNIQSIPQAHMHIAEGISSPPPDRVSIIGADSPNFIYKLAVIFNHSQELFSKWLVEHNVDFGKPFSYIQKVGLTNAVRVQRTVFEFESLLFALKGADGLKQQLEPIWYAFVASLEDNKFSYPELSVFMKTSYSPNLAFLIPTVNDNRLYNLDTQKTYVFAGTISSPVELLMKGGGWLNRI